MRKIIAGINMTLDGFCDHTAVDPDEEVHDHYTEFIKSSDTILYGRTTFDLMKFWQDLVKKPSGEKSMDDFAIAIDKIHKIVFSDTLKNKGPEVLGWETAALANKSLEETTKDLKQGTGKDVLVGSRSIILQLMNLNLLDELQLCVHPVILGKGLPLFDKINERGVLKLLKTKTFKSGAILLYYKPNV